VLVIVHKYYYLFLIKQIIIIYLTVIKIKYLYIIMIANIFTNIYNLYNKGNDVDLQNYIYNNSNKILEIINKTIELDNKAKNKYIFFYKNYEKIKKFYDSFLKTEDIYLKYLLFSISFRIIIINSLIRNTEIVEKNNEKLYYITILKNKLNEQKFVNYMLLYYLEAYFCKKLYIGIDFEFNKNIIALIQINFESHQYFNESFIFIIVPQKLEKITSDLFINKILQNPFIQKILHGSDSLDIPFIYNHLFENDKDKIIKFTKHLVDTRFMCEYIDIIKNKNIKCSIYEALLYFKTINKNKYDELIENHTHINMEDNVWNIEELNKFQIVYTANDVLFLKNFYNNIINNSDDDIRIYKYVIPEITRFLYLERRNITNILEKYKDVTNKMNNYFTFFSNKRETLISLYKIFIDNFELYNPKIKLSDLLKINFFKSYLNILFKTVFYHKILNKKIVYINRNEQCNEKIDITELLEYMDQYNFSNIKKIILNISLIRKINYLSI